MTQAPSRRDTLKWFILALTALTIAGSYYSYDAIAPVADLLRRQRHFSQSQIAALNSVFSLPNIPLALLGGVVIDRIGAATASLIAAALSFIGCLLTAIGVPYALMLVGRLIFGVGTETLYIALLVGLAQWFARGGAALSVALFFSMARVGSYTADISPSWAARAYASGWQPPLFISAAFTGIGLLAAIAYWQLDRKYHDVVAPPTLSERFRWSQLRGFGVSFWSILWLNVLFASVFFPFRSTFSIQYFQDVRGLTLAEAGLTNSWVFFAAIIATPICGLVADRIGRRATLLMIAAALLPLTFVVLGTTRASLWVSTTMMGISFSVIPAVIWPATAMLVPPARIGTAYGLINMLQSLGLTVSNMIAGALNDRFEANASHPNGYAPMLGYFALVGGIAFLAALRLWISEHGSGRHGLQEAQRA